MDDKKFEFFKIDDLLKDNESINPYGEFNYQPSKGKLNRMILAGYYALRWINEKLDNAQDFVENILALRAEANRIVGELPAPKKAENSVLKVDKKYRMTEKEIQDEMDYYKSEKPEMFHVEQTENKLEKLKEMKKIKTAKEAIFDYYSRCYGYSVQKRDEKLADDLLEYDSEVIIFDEKRDLYCCYYFSDDGSVVHITGWLDAEPEM